MEKVTEQNKRLVEENGQQEKTIDEARKRIKFQQSELDK